MNNIETGYFPISELPEKLSLYLNAKFSFLKDPTRVLLQQRFSSFKTDIKVFIEYPYVDKLYRNTFYNYFSTKHKTYERDCVRLSFFKSEVDLQQLSDLTLESSDSDICLGYMIIRPIFPNFFGRGILSPSCFKYNSFSNCYLDSDILISNKRFKVRGFPFTAQDSEYMKCAETTIWETLEYFGNKYQDYKAVLPSEIIKALSKYSFERQVPSHGLSAEQISFALKEFGFGVRMYDRSAYQTSYLSGISPYKDFFRILHYYVDSGIPVIGVVSNGKTNHAVLHIGYEPPIVQNSMQGIEEISLNILNFAPLKVIDYSDMISKYVIIDDNKMPYQLGNFTLHGRTDSKYLSYYDSLDDDFKNLELKSFIVPLHSKIYLEASQARQFIFNILKKYPVAESENIPLYLRLFLTTSRSFKNWIASENGIDNKIKRLVVSTTMPKFIWVGELSNNQLNQHTDKKAFGFVIVDATQANVNSIDNMIFLWHPETVGYFDSEGKFAVNKKINIKNEFNQYKNY